MSAPEGSTAFISDKAKEVLLQGKLYSSNPEAMAKLNQLHHMKNSIISMEKSLHSALREKDILTETNEPIRFLNRQ